MDEKNLALEAIRRKLVGKTLSYKEVYAVMDQIAHDRLGDVLTTYFVASGYSKGFSDDEIYYLTKAMVETGEKLGFKGIVADKHSIGGAPGTRTTLIIVPIIASAGFRIPKSSSRAITTPAGTADVMETLCKVTFSKEEICKIVENVNACIVWGGSFKIAPADDEIIRIEEPLLFESYDKILVSVMAKKIAFGSNHVVVDIPYGKTMKVHRLEDANLLAKKFENLAKKFEIKLFPVINKAEEPAGFGIGPILEARDSLKVLEQTKDRSISLEKKSLDLSSVLLDLCLKDSSSDLKNEINKKYQNTRQWAEDLLISGEALNKMREIIKFQNGDSNVSSGDLVPGKFVFRFHANKTGKISEINCKNVTIIAKILGAPKDKKAGVLFHKKTDEVVEKGEKVYNLYSNSEYMLKEAVDTLDLFPVCTL